MFWLGHSPDRRRRRRWLDFFVGQVCEMDCAHAAVRTELRLILSNALLLPPFSAQGRQSLFAIKPCPPLHRLRERMSRRKQDNPMQLKRTLTGKSEEISFFLGSSFEELILRTLSLSTLSFVATWSSARLLV